MKHALIVIGLVFASPAQAAIYKCFDAEGHIKYANKPCEGAGELLASDEAEKQAKTPKVHIGMKAAAARKAWGEPARVNRTVTAGGVSEQWVYGAGAHTQHLFFENNVLRAIHTND